MGILVIDRGTGKAESGTQAAIDDSANKLTVGHASTDKLIGAIAAAVLDEINACRLGLVVPLLEISKDDWIDKIKAKLA